MISDRRLVGSSGTLAITVAAGDAQTVGIYKLAGNWDDDVLPPTISLCAAGGAQLYEFTRENLSCTAATRQYALASIVIISRRSYINASSKLPLFPGL